MIMLVKEEMKIKRNQKSIEIGRGDNKHLTFMLRGDNIKPHFIFILARSVKAENTLYQFPTVKSCFDVAFDFPNLTPVIALLQNEDRMMISGFGAIISSL